MKIGAYELEFDPFYLLAPSHPQKKVFVAPIGFIKLLIIFALISKSHTKKFMVPIYLVFSSRISSSVSFQSKGTTFVIST